MERQIIFYFIFVAVTHLAYSKHVSSWDQRVFPDDLEWFPAPKSHRIFDSVKNNVDVKNNKICETPECKKVAEEFLSSMNKSIDPCEDFYEFSCGGWASKNPIPPSSPVWSRLIIFQNTVKSRIRDFLETEVEPTDILPVRQAKKWYRSCMDIDTLERRSIKPIESILLQAGGWPISMDTEEWDAEEYTWQKVDHHYAHFTGSYAFYQIKARPSSDEESKFGEILIAPPEIPLTDKLPLKYRNYTGNDYDAYIRLVEGAADMFVQHNRADVSKKKVRKEAEEIVEFEKQLYELANGEAQWISGTLKQFIQFYQTNMADQNLDPKLNIDWGSGIQGLFDMVNIKVDPSTEITTGRAEYVKKIGGLLNKTPVRTIVNYIHWNFVANMLPYTTELMRDTLFDFVSEEYGVTERPPRWSECVSEMKMSHAAAYRFVNKYFTKPTKNNVVTMIDNIRIEIEKKMENSNWLDETSKVWAKDKLNSMKIFVGFPEWYKNKTAVINYYKGLTIGTEYFDNTLSYMRYKSKQNLKAYIKPRDITDDWHIDPITVNAFYIVQDNIVNVPASDFQAPLFTPKLPDTVNYGIAGVVVGHEMSHGFDDTGIQFDKDGNETKLSENMLKSYSQRADCFLDQFGKYYGEKNTSESAEDTSENEERGQIMSMITRGENIADTTGLQAVFQAYKMLNKSGDDLKLPGLEDFTDDQLFFLSFAGAWCEIGTPQYEEKEKESRDEHSPPRFRVIGAVSNTKAFAKAFNCPTGSSMNPSNKCNIWQKPEVAKSFELTWTKKNHRNWLDQWRS